ncbi:unnamed protein product [[Candida] boidinii]|uniref:Unnamed protein product n=1 Tax=Candida boidinii TaxID=5477 RepID=A0A9W6T456_CANBO|nr:hypothetical protein BVG19_g2360 [[Candida] boidinii]OWB51396.1 hypothetical protein B5S27_g2956 [[Candida] boidinii]OWB65838.1 hypothetical protein B5S30_g1170 [[Candida] boidinii]GME71863.1 unnamed protein product [[Candida] boidinii]
MDKLDDEENLLVSLDANNDNVDEENDDIQDWGKLSLQLNSKGKGKNKNSDIIKDSDKEIESSGLGSSSKVLLKRGTKFFEPLEGVEYDMNQLEKSRELMYEALGKPRGFATTATTLSSSVIRIRRVVESTTTEDPNDIESSDYKYECYMISPRGKFMDSMGVMKSDGKTFILQPEEAYYLIERGACIAKLELGELNGSNISKDDDDNDGLLNIPLTLQDIHALLFNTAEELDNLSVYSYLKRQGYIVQRHNSFNHNEVSREVSKVTKSGEISNIVNENKIILINKLKETTYSTISYFGKFFKSIFSKFYIFRYGSLRRFHFETSYKNVFNQIRSAIFPVGGDYDGSSSHSDGKYKVNKDSSDGAYNKFTFDVYKPMNNFPKKTPPLPDFQVVVINSNKFNFPSYNEINHLIRNSNLKKESKYGDIYSNKNRLDKFNNLNLRNIKYGDPLKKITIAVVDNGVINLINLAEINFSKIGCVYQDDWRIIRRNPYRHKRGNKKQQRGVILRFVDNVKGFFL